MPEKLVFLLGFIIFTSAVIIFSLIKKKNDYAVINKLVFLTTTISYTVLLSDIWILSSSFGQAIYPTRWLFYILSCSLLMYEIGKILNKSFLRQIELIILNIMVMLAGFLASISLSPYKWLFFIISSLAFIFILQIIRDNSASQNNFMKGVSCYIVFSWTLFPIVWFLAPTGIGFLSALATAFLYLCLDIITKIIFGYYTIKGKF